MGRKRVGTIYKYIFKNSAVIMVLLYRDGPQEKCYAGAAQSPNVTLDRVTLGKG